MSERDKIGRIFALDDAAQFGNWVGKIINNEIQGRYAGAPYDWGVLAQSIVWAGHGDHLEIGTLFGGSAILAALVKKAYDISGNIICIDPLEGYYGEPIDPVSELPITIEVVLENITKFALDDRIKLVQAKSQPWPLSIEDEFVSAFIDGQHDYKSCLSDWLNCKNCVSKVIQFDNFGIDYPQVCNVVSQATQSEWIIVHVGGISAVLAKRNWLWKDYEKQQVI